MKNSIAMGVPDRVVTGRKTRRSLRSHDFAFSRPLYAAPGMRVLATAFDMVVLFLIFILLMILADAQVLQVGAGHDQDLWMDAAILAVFVPFVYFVGCWALFGASPGKMLLSLHVVDAQTQGELSVSQCLLRYVGCLLNIFSFGLGMAGIFKMSQPQGWHDRLAGTYVIQH